VVVAVVLLVVAAPKAVGGAGLAVSGEGGRKIRQLSRIDDRICVADADRVGLVVPTQNGTPGGAIVPPVPGTETGLSIGGLYDI
jgi:hypothetical protein